QRFAAAGIGDGLEGPRAPELPRLRLTRKALVRLHRRDVLKLALQGRPRPSAVVAALDHVAEPGRPHRGVEPVGVEGGGLQVEDFTSLQQGSLDRPRPPRRVEGEDETALARPNQYTHPCHASPSREEWCAAPGSRTAVQVNWTSV